MDQKHDDKHGKQVVKKTASKFISQRTAKKFESSVDRFESSIKELENILKKSKLAKK